jgi:hypothetical protein
MTTFTISNSVRVDICKESMDDHLAYLNYCIEHSKDQLIVATMTTIRDNLPKHVQLGNCEIVSMACCFIKETYDSLVRGKLSTGDSVRALALLNQINHMLKAIADKYLGDLNVAQELMLITSPLQANIMTPESFITVAEEIISKLRKYL